MRARFPLFLKIVTWFLLNLAVLTIAFFFLFRSQFGIGLDGMLEGNSGAKITRAVELISDQLQNSSTDNWERELERFSDAYGVTFSLYRSNGDYILGPDSEIPDKVREEIGKHSLAPPNDGSRGGAPRKESPPPRRQDDDRDGDGIEPDRDNRGEGSNERRRARQPQPLFLIKTAAPKTFWLGCRVQAGGRNSAFAPDRNGRRPPPDLLLARTDHISGNDLLPDLRPWIAAGVGVIVLSVLFWIPFVGGITRSLRQIRDATEEVAAGHFDTAVSESRSDELGQLGRSINRMSKRLNGYVEGQQRFLGDIAHELCSPIARMQMALSVLEQRATPQQLPRVTDVRDELEHMASMVDELLSFSKASLQPESIKLERVPLAPLINEIASRETGGRDAEILLEESAGLIVMADRNLLGRALGNLLRNALRYAGEVGPITFDAEAVRLGKIEIKVADSGPGVPESALAQILDPFYRPDEARSRERGGAGLGLAIVKTCIEACGGSIACRNTNPGFEVTLTLEAAPSWN